MLEIIVEEYEAEYQDLLKAKNAFLHFHKIPEEAWQAAYAEAEQAVEHSFKRIDSVVDQFEIVKHINSDITGYSSPKTLRDRYLGSRPSHEALGMQYSIHLLTIACRAAACRRAVDHFAKIDEWHIACTDAVVKARSDWRHGVQTNIGYRSHIGFEIGTPGEVDISTEASTHWRGTQAHHLKATVYVDGTYSNLIKQMGFHIVDIAGKACLTISADEITGHELEDKGVRLFNSKVIYTKVPRTIDSWGMTSDEAKSIFHVEDKVIAVQPPHGEGGSPTIATGKDQSWAVRTMKGRLKKRMYAMMGV